MLDPKSRVVAYDCLLGSHYYCQVYKDTQSPRYTIKPATTFQLKRPDKFRTNIRTINGGSKLSFEGRTDVTLNGRNRFVLKVGRGACIYSCTRRVLPGEFD